jgi:argininosuccinate synthase
MTRIVLAYSGSGATANAIAWLSATYGAEVVTLTLDLGQGKELEAVRDRALSMGAIRAHVLDAHDQFVREYFLRALRAGALFDGGRSLVAALSLPLIAQKLAEVAAIEQTSDVAHASASGDVRIATAIGALAPQLDVVAVPRERGESDASARTAAAAPAEPAFVEISFERGSPVALNGIAMPLIDLLSTLDIIASAPAAQVLDAAHNDLQAAAGGAPADEVRRRYVEVIDRGRWFDPARAALDADVTKLQARVSGVVRLKLFEGGCEIVERRMAKPSRKLTVIA